MILQNVGQPEGCLVRLAQTQTRKQTVLGERQQPPKEIFALSNRVAGHVGANGTRYWSETMVREAIRSGPRIANIFGKNVGAKTVNFMTTNSYKLGGGSVVVNWITRKVVHYFPY